MQSGEAQAEKPSPFDCAAVIVLYRCALQDSSTFTSLIAAQAGMEAQPLLLVYDNSPLRPERIPSNVIYEHDALNSGLAAAYAWGLRECRVRGIQWILLLDQDSILPLEFLKVLLKSIQQYETDSSVVGIVPTVRSGGKIVSPMQVRFRRLSPLPPSTLGIQSGPIMAINSGAALRCEFVQSIGGFNSVYKLDYLDHWLFQQVHKTRRKIALSDSVLEHNLSVQHYRRDVSASRYRSILTGEAAFITTHKPKLEIPFYLLHLLCRGLKQLVFFQSPEMAAMTTKMFLRIAAHPLRSLEKSQS